MSSSDPSHGDIPIQSASKVRVAMIAITLVILIISGSIIGISYFVAKSTLKTQIRKDIPTSQVPPSFSDVFNDNTQRWNLKNEPGKYSVQIGNGNITLENNNNKLLWEQLPGQRSYDDFKLFVDATLTRRDPGNAYGVYIRGTSNTNNNIDTYYRFELYGNGGYAIFKGIVNSDGTSGYHKLIAYTSDPAVSTAGKLNHLLITAKGYSLTLIVNGHVLKTITDTSYTRGTIALFVSNMVTTKVGVQAQFSNLSIYPANA